jgi:hypothetical protein
VLPAPTAYRDTTPRLGQAVQVRGADRRLVSNFGKNSLGNFTQFPSKGGVHFLAKYASKLKDPPPAAARKRKMKQ